MHLRTSQFSKISGGVPPFERQGTQKNTLPCDATCEKVHIFKRETPPLGNPGYGSLISTSTVCPMYSSVTIIKSYYK